jgi:hypothetical protein
MAELTKAEREALGRLLLGVRTSIEALHETVTGVLQLLHAEREEAPPQPRRPRYLGDNETEQR